MKIFSVKKAAAVTALLLVISSMLCSCNDGMHKIVYEDDHYIDRSNGVKYLFSPISYEPVSVGEEYGKCGDTVLYQIPNAQPEEWLTEEFQGIGGLYYSENTALPTLSEMKPTAIHMCATEVLTIGIGTIDDADIIAAVVDAIENGEDCGTGSPSVNYSLKFESEEYPFLYYSVVYFADSTGEHYIYDRSTRRTVAVGTLISSVLPDE